MRKPTGAGLETENHRKPDWTTWLECETVRILTAVALSLDVDPALVNIRNGRLSISTVFHGRIMYEIVDGPLIEEAVKRYNILWSYRSLDIRTQGEIARGDQPLLRLKKFVVFAYSRGRLCPVNFSR